MLFALCFFIVRIIFGFYVTIELWFVFVLRDYYKTRTNINGIPKYAWISILFINVLFHILNLWWFSVIVKSGIKAYKKAKNQNPSKKD